MKKANINLKACFFAQQILKAKMSEKQAFGFLETYALFRDFKTELCNDKFLNTVQQIKDQNKQDILYNVVVNIENKIDLELFIFSLKIFLVKDLLLQEAKIGEMIDMNKLENINPLSLEYEKISTCSPCLSRVNSVLLALLFFENLEEGKINFMSKDAFEFIKKLSKLAMKLKNKGIESNQIFMLIFSESVDQSIIADSGSNYEDRILFVLKKIGIPKNKIRKTHDKDDASTEFDFFFELNGKTYGVGAKKTLRERYKQFIKTAQMGNVDIMIEITLGMDLNEEKAKNILNHGVYIFVADEIYKSRKFLQKIKGVYSAKNLTLKTLKSLKKIRNTK